jgi:WhiB family redox-sensing transcriptional regulator
MFYPRDGEKATQRDVREGTAKLVCNGCAVRLLCLNHAIHKPELHGVWGGLTPNERHVIGCSLTTDAASSTISKTLVSYNGISICSSN